jgi:hypothetical protein
VIPQLGTKGNGHCLYDKFIDNYTTEPQSRYCVVNLTIQGKLDGRRELTCSDGLYECVALFW